MRLSSSTRWPFAVFATLLSLSQAACVAPGQQYRAIDLGVLSCPNGQCQVGNVNNSCEVAGYDGGPNGDFAIIWQPTSSGAWTARTLPQPTKQYSPSPTAAWVPSSVLAATSFRAFAINELGEVIGLGKGPRNEAVLWQTRASDPLGIGAWAGAYLGGLPNGGAGAASEGYGINNSSQVTGNSKDTDGNDAVRWSASGGMTKLGRSTGITPPTVGYGIDDIGEVVGDATVSSNTGSVTHAFYADTSTNTMQDLGHLPTGQDFSHATAVLNSDGIGPIVVGNSGTTGGSHAIRWEPSTGLVDLGELSAAIGESSGADAISPLGIFGFSTINNKKHATAWQVFDLQNSPKNTPIDLNTLVATNSAIGSFVLEEATGVNLFGMISAIGNVGGVKHAFLVVPTLDDLPGLFSPSIFRYRCGRPTASAG